MEPPQRIFTNFPKAQIMEAIRELDLSMEVDRTEVGLYRILDQKLSEIYLTAPREPRLPMGLDFAIREKDQMRKVLQGLVRKEYDEINEKQEVISFLYGLIAYAT